MPGAEPILAANERILILIPDRNSPPKNDFTGAFLPEANALQKAYGAQCKVVRIAVPVVNPKTLTIAPGEKQNGFHRAARATLDAIRSGSWSRIVFMCHGWDAGFQLGFRLTRQKGSDAANLRDLVEALRAQRAFDPGLRSITLFACSAGDEPASEKSSPGTGDNSIADYLRDQVGCTVIAHWTTGHATRNPDLITFNASPVPLVGGVAYPERGKQSYRNTVRLLTNTKDRVRKVAPGSMPPKGHTRLAFASIPLCNNVQDLQTLLSSEPAF